MSRLAVVACLALFACSPYQITGHAECWQEGRKVLDEDVQQHGLQFYDAAGNAVSLPATCVLRLHQT